MSILFLEVRFVFYLLNIIVVFDDEINAVSIIDSDRSLLQSLSDSMEDTTQANGRAENKFQDSSALASGPLLVITLWFLMSYVLWVQILENCGQALPLLLLVASPEQGEGWRSVAVKPACFLPSRLC